MALTDDTYDTGAQGGSDDIDTGDDDSGSGSSGGSSYDDDDDGGSSSGSGSSSSSSSGSSSSPSPGLSDDTMDTGAQGDAVDDGGSANDGGTSTDPVAGSSDSSTNSGGSTPIDGAGSGGNTGSEPSPGLTDETMDTGARGRAGSESGDTRTIEGNPPEDPNPSGRTGLTDSTQDTGARGGAGPISDDTRTVQGSAPEEPNTAGQTGLRDETMDTGARGRSEARGRPGLRDETMDTGARGGARGDEPVDMGVAPGLFDEQDTAARRERRANEARQQVAQAVSEETGQDYTAEDVTITQTEDGSLQFDVDQRESFDIDWSFGLGGPEDEVENTIDDAGAAFSRRTSSAANDLFATDTETENSAGAMVLRAAGRDSLASSYDQRVRNFGAGAYSGAAAIGNVPGIAGGVMEGVEVGAAGVSQTASGSGGEFVSDAGERGNALKDSAVEQAKENPYRTGGALAGSLVGSAGAISAASRVSSRAGTAARWTIQPGEELAGTVGYYSTRAAAGQRAADRAFPNKEPVIFSEEAAIRGGKAAVDATRRAGSSAASKVARRSQALRSSVGDFSSSNRGQMQIGRQRSSSSERETVDFGGAQSQQDFEADLRQQELTQNQEMLRDQTSRERSAARDLVDDPRNPSPIGSGGDGPTFNPDDPRPAGPARPTTRTRNVGQSVPREMSGLGRADNVPSTDLRQRATQQSARVETETLGMSRASGRRLETSVDTGVQSSTGRSRAAQEAAVSPLSEGLESNLVGRQSRLNTETGLETGLETRTETETRSPLESRSRSDTELASETRTDTRMETRSRSEMRSELGLESQTETRREFERDDMRGDTSGGQGLFGGLTGSGDVLERDLINPFTGE